MYSMVVLMQELMPCLVTRREFVWMRVVSIFFANCTRRDAKDPGELAVRMSIEVGQRCGLISERMKSRQPVFDQKSA